MRLTIRQTIDARGLRPAPWVRAAVVVLGTVSTSHANTPMPGTTAESDSVVERRLGFRPAPHPGDLFSVSNLTISYEQSIASFSNTTSRQSRDLAWLDRYGNQRPRMAETDSSNIRLVDEAKRQATELTPTEKKTLEPPAPPVQVGIPSPVAVGASLLGGIALLAKVIAALLR